MPVFLVMILSAFSGVAAVVNGVLILVGQIKLETRDDGVFGSLLHNGLLGTIVWIILGVAALAYQMRDVGQSITSIERTAYRY